MARWCTINAEPRKPFRVLYLNFNIVYSHISLSPYPKPELLGSAEMNREAHLSQHAGQKLWEGNDQVIF